MAKNSVIVVILNICLLIASCVQLSVTYWFLPSRMFSTAEQISDSKNKVLMSEDIDFLKGLLLRKINVEEALQKVFLDMVRLWRIALEVPIFVAAFNLFYFYHLHKRKDLSAGST